MLDMATEVSHLTEFHWCYFGALEVICAHATLRIHGDQVVSANESGQIDSEAFLSQWNMDYLKLMKTPCQVN